MVKRVHNFSGALAGQGPVLGRDEPRAFHHWWMSELLNLQPWQMDDLRLAEYASAHYYLQAKNGG